VKTNFDDKDHNIARIIILTAQVNALNKLIKKQEAELKFLRMHNDVMESAAKLSNELARDALRRIDNIRFRYERLRRARFIPCRKSIPPVGKKDEV